MVRRALLQLPDIYRTALVLRHYENLKLREIADILEVPEGTVNSRLAEGLARLTRILEPQLHDPPGRVNQGQSHGSAGANRPPDIPSLARGDSSSAPTPNLPMKTVAL